MSLSIGIVGLPNVGKSTLFTALTKKTGLAANYPFATIDPNVGIVDVPDSRLQKLADIVNPGRIVPATVEFVDLPTLGRPTIPMERDTTAPFDTGTSNCISIAPPQHPGESGHRDGANEAEIELAD